MRNATIANSKVPGHKELGPNIADIVAKYIKQHPHVLTDVINAIGKPKKMKVGPKRKEIWNVDDALRFRSRELGGDYVDH